ncbi:MAG: hypothetical protein WCR86_14000 [Parabacteroides sp.]
MKKRTFLLIAVMMIFVNSCGTKTKDFRNVFEVPDSLTTPEIIQEQKEIYKFVVGKITIKDLNLILDATKKDFKDNNIPTEYYDYFSKELKSTSKSLKQWKKESAFGEKTDSVISESNLKKDIEDLKKRSDYKRR